MHADGKHVFYRSDTRGGEYMAPLGDVRLRKLPRQTALKEPTEWCE
jgi:hypothetical protein